MLKRKIRLNYRTLVILLMSLAALGAAAAQERSGEARRSLTAADYAQAEKFMPYSVAPLIYRAGVRPAWLAGDRFWYRNSVENQGGEFILVDPARGTRGPAFNQAGVAAALSAASGKTYNGSHLPFTTFELSTDGKTISFRADGRVWSCNREGKTCRPLEGGGAAPAESQGGQGVRSGAAERPEALSPDGLLAAFLRSDNLWVRDAVTGREKQLTTDGLKDFGYATDNAGWIKSDRPVVLWSPDSKKIATFQQDQRGVGEMYLVETKVGRPVLQAWKYPLPGDEVVTTIQRVIIHLNGPHTVRLKMPPDQHRSTFT
ncbi:MAG: DPP IV N-terminal domain-containing protein, partial [Candidatus Aminicenantales bacterium]